MSSELSPDLIAAPAPSLSNGSPNGSYSPGSSSIGTDSDAQMPAQQSSLRLASQNDFQRRHIGPNAAEIETMLAQLGLSSLEDLIERAVPAAIRMQRSLQIGEASSEQSLLADLKAIAAKNQIFRSYIGMGYANCFTPTVIQRNILENPGWYTQYTPYQPEIAQGRLEALLNYQTLIIDLTGLEIANASLLDEGTAAAEAMAMSYGLSKGNAKRFWVSELCHPQTIDVIRTRALPLGITVVVGDHRQADLESELAGTFGLLLQYPATDGAIYDYEHLIQQAHQAGALVTVAADLLSLTLLKPPGEFGADIVVGNSQRFGVPLGYGGPHAAFFATREAYKRQIPGRLVGISKDVTGKPALRLALQTREQHIRRDKATSNICTAQVLLAIMASMYAVYHGAAGLRQIAAQIHSLTVSLATGLSKLGYSLGQQPYFDTLRVEVGHQQAEILSRAVLHQINLRPIDTSAIGISLDETTCPEDIQDLLAIFAGAPVPHTVLASDLQIPASLRRTTPYLTHPVFSRYQSETELLRYIHKLQAKDLSLTTAMIPLGSCTMKLNATSEMIPVTWPEFANLHPFVPLNQAEGYQIMFRQLEAWLAEITGFDGISLQPNAGSQGEYAGLLVIRQYHQQRGEAHRRICLIPESAHGTNPASAVMAGMKVVPVACDDQGNIDIVDLEAKAEKYSTNLAALMVTYPSTHGVFEAGILEICAVVHRYGGQVYMDGANMNAQVGLCRPADFGADLCHLNLHKTFCIPHGGGGPGMGPIGVKAHLVPFLPGHAVVTLPDESSSRIGAVSAAPWGSGAILPISWMYIGLMGGAGLTRATEVAILNANYIAKRLEGHYPVLYKGESGLVAHECILDLRQFKKSAGIEVDDIAKRLIDYGFHPPTVSWPVAGTIMVEPTESESKQELDRFCDALIAIRQEIAEIESGKADPQNNLLKHAPHSAATLLSDSWDRPYSRQQAAYPTEWTREQKFWAAVDRIDNAYGDRNLVCACLPMEAYAEQDTTDG